MKFLVNGSIAYDLLLSHDGSFIDAIDPKHLERLSVNYLAQRFIRHHGGTAANIAWHLALLGQRPMAISTVGFDGVPYLELLRERGVDVTHVERRQDTITATAVIATDTAERQISFFYSGADGFGSFPDLSNERDDIAYAIMSPRNPLLMLKGASECARLHIPYLFDPGQVVHAFGQSDLRTAVENSAGLIVNEYEWTLCAEKLRWTIEQVVERCGMLIITRGDQGMTIQTKREKLQIPVCPPSTLINPTGAGDGARAGLLVGLAQQWPMIMSGRLAAILGSLLCEQEGTLLDALDLEEVQARAVEVYGEGLPAIGVRDGG